MAYQKYYPNGWKSGEVGATPITPEALNNMENGIAAAVRTEDIVDNLTSTATNKPLSAKQGKVLEEHIAQSTANQVTQGTISNVKISDTVRTDSVPVGISLWQTQRATDSPMNGTVTTTIIIKPISSGQYSSALLFGSDAVFVSSGLASSGDFTWTRIQ